MKLKKFTCLLLIVLSSLVYAQTNKLRVGFTPHKHTDNKSCMGYEYEYFQEISKYTGWSYEYVEGTREEYIQWLKEGKIDIILDYSIMPKDKWYISSDLVVQELTRYVFKRIGDYRFSFEITPNWNGKKTGIVSNTNYKESLDKICKENGIQLEYVFFDTIEELLEEFEKPNSELDFLCSSDYLVHYNKNLVPIYKISSNERKAAFNSKNNDLLIEFNKAQKALVEEKPYFNIRLKEKFLDYKNRYRDNGESQKAWLKEHDTITIGYSYPWFPFCSSDKEGNVKGFLPVYVEEILNNAELGHLKINYQPYRSYQDAIQALKNNDIDIIFPLYGEFFEAEKQGVQKSNTIVSLPMDLIFFNNTDYDNLQKIVCRKDFCIYENYANQFLNDFDISVRPNIFGPQLKKILSEDNTAILLNAQTSQSIVGTYTYKDINKIELLNKCPIAFAVRRDDIGLLSIIDSSILKTDSSFAINKLNEVFYSQRKYGFKELIQANLGIAFAVIILLASLIVTGLLLYIRAIIKAKKQVELSKKEVDKALKKAEKANKSKSTFLNNQSHDMRTPMNAILGFTELALRNINDTKKVEEYLNKINISSTHLLHLINDVLDMSRIESGKIGLDIAPCNINSLVQDLMIILQTSIDEKHLDFKVDIGSITKPYILCDSLRLNQIFLNLLSNAVKYTPANGKINLTIKEKEIIDNKTQLEIIVNDNGVGMSKEFQEQLFEAFQREHTYTVNRTEGSGLGMAITKKLVDKMGGTISVEAEQGKGSTFTVNLEFEFIENGNFTNKKINNNLGKNYKVDYTGKKVLLVEDNELNQEIAKALLEANGFEVDIASDGRLAVEKINNNPILTYNLVLMDIQMPNMDGYEATRIIRNMRDNDKASIPIIALSANAFSEEIKKAKDAGMDDYVSKPINIEDLLKVIGKFIIS